MATIVVAALVAMTIGVGIGSRLHRNGSAVTAVLPTPTVPPGAGALVPSAGNASSGPVTAQAAAVAAKVNPGIVDINTKLGYQNAAGAGTGMILSSSGEILTNNHVVDGATGITVTLVSNGHTYAAAVVGTDPTEDVAVLQLKGVSGLKPIQVGNSSAVASGDAVVALGNAGGAGGTPAVATGSVVAVGQTITASDQGGANAETLNGLIKIDAPIQPGDSGGPLVNMSGQVIGMDTAASASRRFSSGTTSGFAIPIAHAVSIAGNIVSGPATATIHLGLPSFLGVSIDPASSGGAVITDVSANTPAANIGLAAGDTVTAIAGHAVTSAQSLSALTKSHRPGEKVSVSWTDSGGVGHTATATLTTGPVD